MSSTARAPFAKESDEEGRFVRQQSRFRDRVTADGSSGVPAATGRYHLYVSYACPWAHRTVIVRALKGLEDAIGMSVVDPVRDEEGWAFRDVDDRTTGDPLHGWSFLSEAYAASDPAFDGRVSVPVLWDTETGRIVNNESADLIVDLNRAFDEFAREPDLDLAPAALAEEMASLDEVIYDRVNNGVYKAGFATTQRAYEEAVVPLFEELDRIDARLGDQRFLLGERQTLSDWRLFTTLVRFDPVYVGHFKCNIRRIADYPHLSGYLGDLYQTPGIAETVDLAHIKRHYYVTHPSINPTQIVPVGPQLDLDAPHGRG